MEFKFEKGEILKDKVTGFQGVVMGRTDYFTDCSHYGLCSQTLSKDGEPIGWHWFDETRLIRIPSAEKILQEPRKITSGIYPDAPEM